MSCKVLFFDLHDGEKDYLEKNRPDYFDIKFFDTSLNPKNLTNLAPEDFSAAVMISVRPMSNVDREIISKFKNLRLISSRAQEYNYIDWRYCLNNNIALINVDTAKDNSVKYILEETFDAMSSFLCGGKDNRIV